MTLRANKEHAVTAQRDRRAVGPAPERSAWIGAVLAALLAGGIAALTNVTNFVVDRPAYFAIWGAAHLLAFGFGFWAAFVSRGVQHPTTYLLLGLVAGAVEALLVFGVLDGLVVVNSRYPLGAELRAGFEDYIAAVSTVLLFAAGAMHGLTRRRSGAVGAAARGSRRGTRSSAPSTEFLTAAGPILTIAAGVLKELL
jgi:hypothetical protein